MKHTVAFIFLLSFLGACANFKPHQDCFNPDLQPPYDDCFKYDGGNGGLKDIPKNDPKDLPKDPKPPVDHPKPPKDKPKDHPKPKDDNGHGNDPGKFDPSNPGKGPKNK